MSDSQNEADVFSEFMATGEAMPVAAEACHRGRGVYTCSHGSRNETCGPSQHVPMLQLENQARQ